MGQSQADKARKEAVEKLEKERQKAIAEGEAGEAENLAAEQAIIEKMKLDDGG